MCVFFVLAIVFAMAPNQFVLMKFLYESRIAVLEQPTSFDSLPFTMDGEKADSVHEVTSKFTTDGVQVQATFAASSDAPLAPSQEFDCVFVDATPMKTVTMAMPSPCTTSRSALARRQLRR
jgi:hypothetical protein